MSSIFCQCSNKRNCFSIDNELKNVYNILDRLLNENRLLMNRFDKLEDIYQRWIGDERFYLLKRIEKLENENHQFYEIYQTYEKSLRSITNLIIKILCTQQELRKKYIDRHNPNDAVQWRNKQQQVESITRNTRSLSCQFVPNQPNDSRYSINDQSIWLHQVKEQDQKTANYSSESTLAAAKSKSEKSSTALANKLYYVINNEKIPIKSTRDNRRSPGINIIPVDDSKQQQQSSVILKKNESQTCSTNSNHERLSTQTPYRTSPIVKNTQTKTKSPRVPTITINTRQNATANQKTVLTTNKSPRPGYTVPKSSEPIRSVGATTIRQPINNKPRMSPTKPIVTNNNKTRIPIVTQQSRRVTDLDVLMADYQTDTSKIISPSSLIQPSLFLKDSVKIVRPVRSQELKLFSCHLTPEKSFQTNESLSTLTPLSNESIIKKEDDDDFNLSSNISSIIRDFSEDSLNEHHHIQKLLNDNIQISSNEQENIEMIKNEGYFLSIDENLNPPYAPPLSLIKPKSISSLIHRLVFPARLGRMIFSRRILSDSDIYQKICSKDNEILHNVYHLDTIRDYSMEFYMLTTYASDSQLRAWIDSEDDEVIGHFNENRFLSSDDKINENSKKSINSSDNIIQEEELDWYSELELYNLSQEKQENTSTDSSENHIEELFPLQQTFTDSSDSWSIPPGGRNQLYSTPLPSNTTDQSNSILREILNHSWTDHISTSNSLQQETGIEKFEDDSTSSIITDEFQPDFYYLCPITKTTSFSKIDSKT